MSDLNEIIEDSVTDATLPEPEVDLTSTETSEPALEATPEAPEATIESNEVKSPAAQDESKVDDFDKKYGLTAQGASGRENRIPYSRVRKITEKAVKDAEATWKKAQEAGFTPTTKYQELETRVKDYEGRLTQVAQFEQVMTQDPNQFMTMLSRLPAYQPFFQRLSEIVSKAEQIQQPPTPEAPVVDDMPQPDQQLSDGSLVYSMDGLKKLNEWNRTQAKREALTETQRILDERVKAVEQRYAPMAQSYENYQARQAVLPTVQKQIAEARQWPLFNDSETEIVDALQKNPTWNLERAYQSVVLPKLQANRDSMRQELLKEVKSAPRSTATVGTRGAKPVSETGEPKSLEDIIKASLDGLNNR